MNDEKVINTLSNIINQLAYNYVKAICKRIWIYFIGTIVFIWNCWIGVLSRYTNNGMKLLDISRNISLTVTK